MANSKNKIYKEDGTFYYYYYEKKKGRKKKRGKKKQPKKIPVEEKKYKTWDFKIIQCNQKKQEKYIGRYHDLAEATAAKNELLKKNEEVLIPMKTISNKRITNRPDRQTDFKSEYLLLKRIRTDSQNNESYIENDYGKIVKHTVTSDRYFIYDKFPCLIEETFWVFGYNPKTERKDIKWIMENFIDAYRVNSYDIIQIYLYNNKVIFRYSGDEINFVMAKNISDAIRVYNFLEKRYKKQRKQVIFTGFTNKREDRAKETISLLKELTGWDEQKIYRKHT